MIIVIACKIWQMPKFHTPVLLNETINLLNIQKDKWYVDCNIGGGGHTQKILEKGGNVIGIDLDNEALMEVSKNLKLFLDNKHLKLFQTNFSNIDQIIKDAGLTSVSGILFDLGVSSHQLETPQRGFSFNIDSALDMRMNQDFSVTARDLINALSEKELTLLFRKYGEENFAKKIAKKIVESRKTSTIETTLQLTNIILSVRPRSFEDKTHPATKVFQALRIAVNDELHSLDETLPKAFASLEKGGRLVVISFHSLEDRIVKNFFKELEYNNLAKSLVKKIVEPSQKEIEQNPRSRSSKLRAIEKI